MLTPMMVQYLVGLCCLRHDPNAIDITLGDMVLDVASKKERDVDVTITILSPDGSIEAFKAAEVKNESKPLDVAAIEQLCIKFADMPQITHKSIFSMSGYTDGAKSKAQYHLVNLYTMMPWDSPIGDDIKDFEGVGSPAEFLSYFGTELLYWTSAKVFVVAKNGPVHFTYQGCDPVFFKTGKKHDAFSNMDDLINKMLMRSTEILFMQEPATTMQNLFPYKISTSCIDFLEGPAWPHSHTIDLTNDKAHLKLSNDLCKIDAVTISGKLQWRKKKISPEFFILRNVIDEKIFAGAAVADYGNEDGRMFVMVFPEKGREIGIHQICITEKQQNMIRDLKIK